MTTRQTTRILFYINALIWTVFGVYTLIRMSGSAVPMIVIGILMFGNAFALFLSGLLLGNPRKIFIFFGTAVLAVNILLTFTDQFGLIDMLTLIFDLIIFGFLVKLMRQG